MTRSSRARFLAAIATLSAAVYDDDLTRSIEHLAGRIEHGEVIDVRSQLEPLHGALLNRIRIAVRRPDLPRLRALWIVIADDDLLRSELEARVQVLLQAKSDSDRKRAASEIVAWFNVREEAIARALRGPVA